MNYKVVPLVASVDPKKRTSNDAAQQLEDLINKYAAEGWKYERLESLTTYVNPQSGCFGLQSKPGYTTARQLVVFSK